ncbi:piwi-like protein Siwi [Planococcus citri]|uniref:piwi-like protein Siwi n=1 Tax=Planococcus citri TaxID=170843 RepID=UPI0031F8CCEB
MEGQSQPGRGKGRGRGRAKPPQQPQPVPSNPSTPSTSTSSSSFSQQPPPVSIGRGRSRAGDPPISVSAPTPPTQQMGGLSVSGGSSETAGDGATGDRPIGRYGIRGGRSLYDEGLLLNTRPKCAESSKKGVSGQKTKFQANFFQLMKTPQWNLNKYHVDFNPVEDRTSMRKILMREHRESLGMYLFDGSTIFSSHNLCPNNKPVEYFSKRLRDDETIRITIKFVGTVEVSDYQNTQVMNIILRECLNKLKLQQIKRNYFDKEARVTIHEHNLELWPGYITAMGQYEYDILLQAEIIYKTLRKDTAYEVFRELTRSSGNRGYKEAFASTIIGTTVMTMYNNKTYRIDDVNFNETPENTFKQKTRDGERDISYRDYYQQKYQVRINDPNQPMLISKTNRRERAAGMPELVYLVPELCMMTGLNDNMRNNFTLMRAVAEHTSVAPSDRMRRLEAFRNRLVEHPEVRAKLDNWGLNLAPNLVSFDGRILPNEKITVGNNRSFPSGDDAEFSRELRNAPLLVPAKLSRWIVMFPSRHAQDAQELSRMIMACGRGMSFHVPDPKPFPIPNDSGTAYVQGIEDCVNTYNPELIVFVVPNNRSDRYNAIKKKTIVDKSLPSQVVLLKNIKAKGAMSIATKITIQINCKLGGAPWGVDNPMKKGMVVGFDVCHDPRDRRRSYGALVASLDPLLGWYYSAINCHASGDELYSSIAINMTKAVNRYMKVNEGRLPSPIIMYRDGVGDGDLKYVFEVEVVAIQEALEKLYKAKNTPLAIAVIIVTKRINTRIFHNRKNPPPGSVVDDVITIPQRFDFFIVSQSVRQGTVSPTHYNVIHNTTAWPVDYFQRMTYKLTHMYFNWSGTVRVPAPCQYAHKLAFLTSQSIGCAHSNLDQLLYFL